MTVVLIVTGLAAAYAFLLWCVRVERGRTKANLDAELARFAEAMADLEQALGEALLPVVRSTSESFARVTDCHRKGSESFARLAHYRKGSG